MKRTLLASIFAFLFLAVTSYAQQSAAPQDIADAQHIAGTILVGGHTLATLQSLTDMGPRLTGSDHYNRAAQWAVEQFHSYGIKDVRLEPFTIPHGWERGPATASMVAPFSWPLHVAAEGWTPSTPANGLHAEVVKLEDISPENLKAQAANLKGKIVVLDLRKMFADRSQAMNNYGKLMAAPALLQQAGVLAVLTGGRMPNNVLGTGALGWKGDIEPLPIAAIGLEDGLLLKRWIERGPVTINLNIQNKISGPVTVNDVVAEIPGTTSPQDWVLMGAHLDSWDFATGAQDNGAGTAQILEAARAIASLGHAPKRSIRFALWGGEEEGLIGSQAYAHNHANEMDHCIAVLNTDNGAGHPQGWKVEKRDDVKKALEPLSKEYLSQLGAETIDDELAFDTDHASFVVFGVPSLDLLVDMSKYGEIHHTPADTIDKVKDHPLADGAAVVAVTGWALADSTAPFAPRLSHDAEGQIIQKAGQLPFVKASGMWQ